MSSPKPVRLVPRPFGATGMALAIAIALGGLAGSVVALAEAPVILPRAQPVGPPSFADVAEAVTAAVVNVTVVQTSTGDTPLAGMLPPGLPEGSPLFEFFRQFHGRQNFAVPREGQGSGFLIDADGYIVTNNHVIDNAERIEVTLAQGDKFTARVVGIDRKTDLALLKIDAPTPLPAVELGSSEGARVGDWVLAVGNPFGLGGSVNAGIISARGRDIRSGPYDDYLQIDAPINRGNSGGPLFDATGKVIGVNTAIFSPSGGNIGIGFAIPAETVARVIEQLRHTGRVERGWLGVQIQPVTAEVAASLGLDDQRGALVAAVLPDGPAQAAGVLPGDLVRRVAGQDIDDYRQLTRLVADLPAGDQVVLEVIRGGRSERLSVAIGQMPSQEPIAAAPTTREADGQPRLGLQLAPLTPRTRAERGIAANTDGVLIAQVEPGSPAARAGIRPGNLLSMVGQQPVISPEAAIGLIREAARQGRPSVLLRIEQDGEARFVAVPFAA